MLSVWTGHFISFTHLYHVNDSCHITRRPILAALWRRRNSLRYTVLFHVIAFCWGMFTVWMGHFIRFTHVVFTWSFRTIHSCCDMWMSHVTSRDAQCWRHWGDEKRIHGIVYYVMWMRVLLSHVDHVNAWYWIMWMSHVTSQGAQFWRLWRRNLFFHGIPRITCEWVILYRVDEACHIARCPILVAPWRRESFWR